MALLLLGSVVLAGLGAWAAAGAATRSVGVRAWAAVVWAGAPALLLGLGDGRLGAVVAHVALPWVALGLARAVGVQRVDQVLSGVATARRAEDDDVDQADVETPVRGTPTVPTPRVSGEAPAPTDDRAGPGGAGRRARPHRVHRGGGRRVDRVRRRRSPARPSLLVPGLLALCVVALCAPRRRGRVLLVAVPALVLLGPTLVEAAGRGLAGWRLLVADPGLPSASPAADPVSRLLGVPTDAVLARPRRAAGDRRRGLAARARRGRAAPGRARAPARRAGRPGGARRLARRGPRAARPRPSSSRSRSRSRTGSSRTAGRVPRSRWPAPGCSPPPSSARTGCASGSRPTRSGGGSRVVALLTAVAVVVPAVWLGSWTWQARSGDAVALRAVERAIVPAVGQQAQVSALSSRVLAVSSSRPATTPERRVDRDVAADARRRPAAGGPGGGASRPGPCSGDLLTPDVDGRRRRDARGRRARGTPRVRGDGRRGGRARRARRRRRASCRRCPTTSAASRRRSPRRSARSW